MTSDPPDPLLEALRRGDPAAFDAVYAREKACVYGFVLRLARDPHVAADLFQNVWLKLARHASALRDDSNLRAWLFTVARREYLSFRRAQALDLSRLLVFGNQPAELEPNLDAELASLKAACGRLSDADREVLLITAVDGLDSDAAAGALGISSPALRQRLARARQRLSRFIAEDERQDAVSLSRKGAR